MNSCGDLTGVCCLDGSCQQLTVEDCQLVSGQFQGYGTECKSAECTEAPAIGACCINGGALLLNQNECNLVSGIFFGSGSSPDEIECAKVCNEDVNSDQNVDYEDLIEVLSAWGPCSG